LTIRQIKIIKFDTNSAIFLYDNGDLTYKILLDSMSQEVKEYTLSRLLDNDVYYTAQEKERYQELLTN
jgi:hypothetical protein